MDKQVESARERKYWTVVQLEQTTDGTFCYVAYHPELPNCVSQGDTPEEAAANLTEAVEMCIEHLEAHDIPVPEFNARISMIAEIELGQPKNVEYAKWAAPTAEIFVLA